MANPTKNTTAALRKTLLESIEKCAAGKLDHADGKNLIGLSNQITSNMAVEVKVMTMRQQLGQAVTVFGALEVY